MRILQYSVLLAGVLLVGCSSKEAMREAIVAQVGGTPVTLREYEDLYIKSNGTRETAAKSSMEERERFLELVTKFKLKLADAYDNHLDRRPENLAEIGQYKASFASSFLTDREVTQPGTKMMHDRRRFEYRASHILISLNPAASSEESTAAYAKADTVLAKLRAGASFESTAVGYSQDPSVSQNKGDLYYFTAGQMVPAFEDAVFQMKVGEISQKPIRTQFGLHIVKLVNKKPARGEIKASHIMIRFEKQDPTPEDTLAAYLRIKAVQDSLKMGLDFAELAKRNSGDPGSSAKGGDLGWFQRRRWIQSFDEVAQGLDSGKVSDIVRTIYGYHLIKVYDEHQPKSFEESKKDVQQAYQSSRFQEDYKNYLAKLRTQTQYKLHEDVLHKFIASLDSNKTTRDSAWWSSIPAPLGLASIVTFGTRGVSVDSVVMLIKTRQEFNNTPLREPGIRTMMDKIGESLVFGVRAETLEKDSPEFAGIVKEYTDGILLYEIEQDRIWRPLASMPDSVREPTLRNYFDKNREKFVWPDRVDFNEIRASDDSVAQLIVIKAMKGQSFEQIAAEDSIRMATQTSFAVTYAGKAAVVTPAITKTLTPVLQQLKKDPMLRAQIVTHPDTSVAKSQNMKLADQRAKGIKAWFTRQGIVEARITAISQPFNRKALGESAAKSSLDRSVNVEVIGRRPMVLGKPEQSVLAITADERSAHADSLTPGAVSKPFRSKYGWSIVKLNRKDPSHQKTYEEAGTEVSSAYQDYESKRLEKEWIDSMGRRYPVITYKAVLEKAFATER
jgi:peptidyl-prolyl cis-trans isomerase SurA